MGGYKTTICHPATSGHRDVSQEIRDTLGITDGFVRISCGVEDARDLVDDLLRALDKTVSAKGPDA
nr:PLP-dependent transferase [uncultured Oscillibacter sp.]